MLNRYHMRLTEFNIPPYHISSVEKQCQHFFAIPPILYCIVFLLECNAMIFFKALQYALVRDHELETLGQASLPPRSIGRPCIKHRISLMDVAATLVSLIFFSVAVTVVWNPSIAVALGQTNQLAVVGFALTVMGFCANRQITLLSLLLEAQNGRSTLQNFEALLQSTPYALDLSISPRLILLSLQALPLGLSVAYKKFSGGASYVPIDISESSWGLVAAPGLPSTGGLSLAVNAYVPFWQNPGLGRTYAYNLYVASNTTAALLDTPFSSWIEPLQAELHLGDVLELTATVNATVSENVNLSPSQQNDPAFWASLESSGWGSSYIDFHYNLSAFATVYTNCPLMMRIIKLTVSQAPQNVTEIFLSIWDPRSQTNTSSAQRYLQSRRHCRGKWSITSSNVTLVEAQLLNDIVDDQSVIQDEPVVLDSELTVLLGEYNYVWHPRVNPSINTLPPLVASMVWAGKIARWGAENWNLDETSDIQARMNYTKPHGEFQLRRKSITLKHSRLLIFVLAVNPILVVLTIVGKALLYSVPISEGFGLISLLSGVNKESLDILQGAALSGTLQRDVRVQFDVVHNDEDRGNQPGRVRIALDSEKPSGSLRRRKTYI